MADENKSKDVLVHADHVKVYFKGKDKKSGTVRAVDDISFDIFAGETFGVVGESGCGKSTLGRTLIRLIPATDGHVYLDGEDISGLKGKALKQMRKKAQIIFQDPSACLNPRRTVRQILMEPFQIHHMTGSMDVDARIEELLHLVGLDTYHLSRYPHELSGGMKRRVGIAQALLNDPEILILDEPTAGLDPGERVRFRNLLSEFAQERIVLISTHIVSDVEYIAAENAVMKAGKIIAQDTTEGLVKQIEAKVWQGNIPMEQLARWEHRLRVVNLRNEPDGTVTLRYLADAPQLPDSIPAQPRLEDLYLWLFPEEMEEAK